MLVEQVFEPVSARSVVREVGLPVEPERRRRPRWPLVMFIVIGLVGCVMLSLGSHREGFRMANPELWFGAWPFLIVGYAGATTWIVRGIK